MCVWGFAVLNSCASTLQTRIFSSSLCSTYLSLSRSDTSCLHWLDLQFLSSAWMICYIALTPKNRFLCSWSDDIEFFARHTHMICVTVPPFLGLKHFFRTLQMCIIIVIVTNLFFTNQITMKYKNIQQQQRKAAREAAWLIELVACDSVNCY